MGARIFMCRQIMYIQCTLEYPCCADYPVGALSVLCGLSGWRIIRLVDYPVGGLSGWRIICAVRIILLADYLCCADYPGGGLSGFRIIRAARIIRFAGYPCKIVSC